MKPKRRAPQESVLTCPICGTQWEPNPYTIKRAPYCSRLCHLTAIYRGAGVRRDPPYRPGSLRPDL